MHYRWEGLAALRKLSADHPRLPLLVLADGILEYRNTWLNPGLPAGCMFQPLLGHKVACVGKSQARVLESWGNVGKCELVGLPRLDSVIPVPLEVPTTGPKKTKRRFLRSVSLAHRDGHHAGLQRRTTPNCFAIVTRFEKVGQQHLSSQRPKARDHLAFDGGAG